MSARDVVVVGCSAGGVEALRRLVPTLPADLRAAVFVVLHVSATGRSVLPKILANLGPLPAKHAIDGEPFEHGHIYVAPPDYHLAVRDGCTWLARGPRQNGHRPAVDALFRSAAYAYGPRVLALVLSGTQDDGAAGLVTVRQRGGLAAVQDPDDAIFPGMPRSAIELAGADHVLAIEALGALVAEHAAAAPDDTDVPVADEVHMGAVEASARRMFSCPECHGPLSELQDGRAVRYECRVGHAYAPESFLALQLEATESALWAAVNALEERSTLLRAMASRAEGRGHDATKLRFEGQAEAAAAQVATLRDVLRAGLAATTVDEKVAAAGGSRPGRKR